MAFTAALLVNVAGALVLTGLGLWVGSRRPRSRLGVAFAVMTVPWGLSHVLYHVLLSTAEAAHLTAALYVGTLLLATAGVAAVAVLVPSPIGWRAWRRLALPIAAGGFLAVMYVLSVPEAVALYREGGRSGLVMVARWTWPSFGLFIAGLAFALVLFPLRFMSEPPASRPRRELVLVAGALAIYPGVNAGTDLVGFDGAFALSVATVTVLLVVAGLWLRATAAGGRDGRAARNVALITLAAPLLGIILGTSEPSASPAPGIARLVTVLVLAYGILRYQILGLDVKLKWTIRQSTVAAAFVVVVFLAGESAQLVFGGDQAWLGLVAGAALVFVLSPLQRFAENVANRAMPDVKPVAVMREDERAGLYREQLRAAYQDGAVDPRERELLQTARAYLGLSFEDAERIEREVAAAARPPLP